MDQTSSSTHKPNSSSKDLDKPSKSSSAIESMEVEYGPDLPPRLDPYDSRIKDALGQVRSSAEDPSRSASTRPKQSSHSSRPYVVDQSSASDHYSDYSNDPHPAPSRPKKHKLRVRFLPSSSEEDQFPERRHRSPKPSRKFYPDQDHPQRDPDPSYYREVALSDIPSQYAEEVDTFRRILKLPDPRESLPRSSTVVMGLDDEKGRQELRPRGPSSMLPLNSIIKDAFDKFDQDFQAPNLPEGKYIKAEYLDLWNKTILIQHRALTCLSKSLAHILQRELYSMGNTDLLRREAEMTLLQPQLGETRRQELRNASFWSSSLFKSQLVKEGEEFLLKKAPYQNKPFRGPHKKRGSYKKRPYGGNSSQGSNQSFSSNRGKKNFRGSRGRFRPHNRVKGMETPLPNDSSIASISPPVGGRLRSFRRDWQANDCSSNVLNIITNGYVLPFLSRPSLVRLHPVSSVKERYRKGGKCKISRVLQSPVSCTQASPEVEASHRLKQAQHFSTRRKVQDGNSRVHQDLPDSRGMGIVDRSIRCLPSHPHTSSLKEIPKILPQVSGVPVHIPPIRTGHSPPGLYNDRKGSQTHGPLQRTQASSIPGRLADQVSVSGESSGEHSGSGRSNPILGVDHKSGKIRTESYSGVFICGLRVPPRFSPCKTHSREMAQTSGFDPTTQVKTCFDCKMFDVSNWVARLDGENGPRGTTPNKALPVSPQGALEISSVTGQPPSLDRSHLCTPRLVAESYKHEERLRPSSQRPQYPTLYRRLK